jgi:hypothetical protein
VQEANILYETKLALESGAARSRPAESSGYRYVNPETPEKTILRIARKNAGQVTPGEVAIEGDMSVEEARKASDATGRVWYGVSEKELASRKFRRSLYVVKDMKKGDVFSAENTRAIRPGFGLAPKHLDVILGRRGSRDIARGTALSWELVE